MIIEGFAVETSDRLIFTVKGLQHPPSRVIAYLRYLPHPAGDRIRDGRRYRRVYHFDEQQAILTADYPTYVADDPMFGLRLQSVPRDRIRTVYDPRTYPGRLCQRGAGDPLEEDALALLSWLHEGIRVPRAILGISGSLMLGLHRADSDLDLVVYGERAARSIHRGLRQILRTTGGALRRPNDEELAALHAEHRSDTPLPFELFARLQTRKVNELRFRGRETFIRFVKLPGDTEERYGDFRFEPLQSGTIRARVIDDRDAIFTPCRYVVADVAFVNGSPAVDVREIVSFRGRFSDQVRAGEWAVARGRLERVTGQEAPPYRRLVVGGQAGDYLLTREPVQDDGPGAGAPG